MVEVAEALVEQEAALLDEGASVRESLVTRVRLQGIIFTTGLKGPPYKQNVPDGLSSQLLSSI